MWAAAVTPEPVFRGMTVNSTRAVPPAGILSTAVHIVNRWEALYYRSFHSEADIEKAEQSKTCISKVTTPSAAICGHEMIH